MPPGISMPPGMSNLPRLQPDGRTVRQKDATQDN